MSLVNKLTRGLIYKDGETSSTQHGGGWWQYGNYWISTRLAVLPTYIKLLPIWLLSLMGHRWSMKILGSALGYSRCFNCGMPWKYTERTVIQYSEHSGMFPLCRECFQKLKPEEIDIHIRKLVADWLESSKKHDIPWGKEETPEEVIAAAEAQMRQMKLTVMTIPSGG